MLTVTEIRDVKFSRAVGGYKPDDVDVLLDKIEADYGEFERIIKDYEAKVESLNSEIENFKNAQNSVQNVLVSAQQLADKIVKEAKEKSEEIVHRAQESISNITAQEKELAAAFELKAQEQKRALEIELANKIEAAQQKADAITVAAEERVAHQQMLFDRLKLEISAFKASISAKYKEHIDSLSKLPDSVPADPKYVTDLLSASYDKPQPFEKVEPQDIISDTLQQENVEDDSTQSADEAAEEKTSECFVIGDVETEEEE